MGEVRRKRRHNIIQARKHRREKIDKLKERYQTADSREREKIVAKILKISPTYPVTEVTHQNR